MTATPVRSSRPSAEVEGKISRNQASFMAAITLASVSGMAGAPR